MLGRIAVFCVHLLDSDSPRTQGRILPWQTSGNSITIDGAAFDQRVGCFPHCFIRPVALSKEAFNLFLESGKGCRFGGDVEQRREVAFLECTAGFFDALASPSDRAWIYAVEPEPVCLPSARARPSVATNATKSRSATISRYPKRIG